MHSILTYALAGLLAFVGLHLLLWGFLRRMIAQARANQDARINVAEQSDPTDP